MLKIAIIGARCRRQGIGEYVARWFARAGARVCAVIGTSPETAALARDNLLRRYEIECRSYTDLETALDVESPDVVAICSPFVFHRSQLEAVGKAGVHCFCEKPLWWEPEPGKAAETARLVDLFIERDRYLATVTQWPKTLPAYYELYPKLACEAVKSFEMLLSPTSTDPRMVLDAAPHPLSMLQQLCGTGRVESVSSEFLESTSIHGDLRLHFDYVHDTGTTEVTCRFATCESRPRPASFAINGLEAHRRIDLNDYSMYLEAEDRTQPLDDPLALLVSEFLENVRTNAPVARDALIAGMKALETLNAAAEEAWMKRSMTPTS